MYALNDPQWTVCSFNWLQQTLFPLYDSSNPFLSWGQNIDKIPAIKYTSELTLYSSAIVHFYIPGFNGLYILKTTHKQDPVRIE